MVHPPPPRLWRTGSLQSEVERPETGDRSPEFGFDSSFWVNSRHFMSVCTINLGLFCVCLGSFFFAIANKIKGNLGSFGNLYIGWQRIRAELSKLERFAEYVCTL